MNREDIVRMAREIGIWPFIRPQRHEEMADMLERFAALIISHHDKANRPKPDASEREWLQQIAYQHGGIGDLSGTEFEFGAMVAAAEREACARVCDFEVARLTAIDEPRPALAVGICAAAIRARTENK